MNGLCRATQVRFDLEFELEIFYLKLARMREDQAEKLKQLRLLGLSDANTYAYVAALKMHLNVRRVGSMVLSGHPSSQPLEVHLSISFCLDTVFPCNWRSPRVNGAQLDSGSHSSLSVGW